MSCSPSPPVQHRSSQGDGSPRAREKKFSRAKSLRHEKSQSPSPRKKRLRRAQADREAEIVVEKDCDRKYGQGDEKSTWREREIEKLSDREHGKGHARGSDKGILRERGVEEVTEREQERNHGRSGDKNMHREIGADRENGTERKERRSGIDENDGKSSSARNGRSTSPSDHHHRSRHRSRSPSRNVDRRERDEVKSSRGTEQWNDDDSVAKMKAAEEALEAKQKQKPSFELSGKLAAETNRVREPLYIHCQSCYLFGRERRVADIPTDHPSCSKQHAVIQFRQVEKEQPDGILSKQVRPYITDLGSTNKTFNNDNPIEPQRYYELFEKDTIKFGNSSREYVLLHENSAS